MVGYTPGEDQLSHATHVFAGGLSGIITRTLTQPLDVIKIRFQLQVEPISKYSHTSKYRGSLHCLYSIIKEERWYALWKGHVGAQGLTAVYMAAEFASFEVLTKACALKLNGKGRTASHFLSGAGAGAFATVVSYPLDVVRTRFIAQNETVYSNLYQATSLIYKTEGFLGFYRGLWAALVHATPQAALHFGCYECFKKALRPFFVRHNSTHGEDALNAFCGAASGFTSKLIIYPLDTGKRRLQVVGFGHARMTLGQTRHYRGLVDYILVAFKEEGLRGFYKGASWALLKSAVTTSMYFYFYEKMCKTIKHYKDE